jgi:hypothetical protein
MSPTDVYVNASGLLSYSVFAFFHSFRLCLGGLKNADLDDRRQLKQM